MATTTANLGLTKPDMTDNVTPVGFNNNFDTIDTQIANLNALNEVSIVVAAETEIWNGVVVKVVKRSGICQCSIAGNSTSAASSGSKESYITIPEGSRPKNFMQSVIIDQNGAQAILRVTPSGQLGIYWLLSDVISGSGWYGEVTWVCA